MSMRSFTRIAAGIASRNPANPKNEPATAMARITQPRTAAVQLDVHLMLFSLSPAE